MQLPLRIGGPRASLLTQVRSETISPRMHDLDFETHGYTHTIVDPHRPRTCECKCDGQMTDDSARQQAWRSDEGNARSASCLESDVDEMVHKEGRVSAVKINTRGMPRKLGGER